MVYSINRIIYISSIHRLRKKKTSSPSPVNRRATTAHGGREAPRLAVAHTNPAVIDVRAGNVTTASSAREKQHKLTKLLLSVNIQNSLGPVHVVISPEKEIYVKEKRRPLLITSDPRCYELHYSQFSLESLKTGESGEFGISNFLSLSKTKHCCQSKGNTKISTSVNKAHGLISFYNFFMF
ncbi:PREDICTED: uncharacterized protein LOC109226280 [Nicotiana attenuata]|uniref:uncharacterized protein LOC109226280 n=1 Tax=Nicotiana attenuata TaxID=49451 RepID=UPI00090494EE|nr:PREDICTED: uncharacterized protein LOC109226280 [Nicotiana attenuata]